MILTGILSVSKQNTTANNDDNNSIYGESNSDEGSSWDMKTSFFTKGIADRWRKVWLSGWR